MRYDSSASARTRGRAAPLVAWRRRSAAAASTRFCSFDRSVSPISSCAMCACWPLRLMLTSRSTTSGSISSTERWRPSASSITLSALKASCSGLASIAWASSTSSLAVSRLTRPISLRYIRTGSSSETESIISMSRSISSSICSTSSKSFSPSVTSIPISLNAAKMRKIWSGSASISATPFHFVDGARELPCLGFKTPPPFRVVPSFGLGKLADYPTVQALHVVEVDAHRQLFSHIVVNTRRRSRPCPSNQVLFLCGITRQLGLEPRRAGALVSLQHPNVYTAILFVQLIRGDLCSHPLEGDRPDRKQLQQISAYGEFLPRQTGRQTVFSVRTDNGLGALSLRLGREEMGLNSDPACRPLSITFPHGWIGDLFQHLAGPAGRQLQVVGISRIQARERVFDPELPARERVIDELLPALWRFVAGGPQELVRVLGRRRDGRHTGAHLMGRGELDGLECGRSAGPVGVEDQQHLVGEALQQADLVVGQRCA